MMYTEAGIFLKVWQTELLICVLTYRGNSRDSDFFQLVVGRLPGFRFGKN